MKFFLLFPGFHASFGTTLYRRLLFWRITGFRLIHFENGIFFDPLESRLFSGFFGSTALAALRVFNQLKRKDAFSDYLLGISFMAII